MGELLRLLEVRFERLDELESEVFGEKRVFSGGRGGETRFLGLGEGCFGRSPGKRWKHSKLEGGF